MDIIFILRGTGIFLVLFYIYPIVPYASALCAPFLLSMDTPEKKAISTYIILADLRLDVFYNVICEILSTKPISMLVPSRELIRDSGTLCLGF